MKTKDIYPSRYVKAEDLEKQGKTAKIQSAMMEKVGEDNKLVLSFSDFKKELVVNKTNLGFIEHAFGDETDNWIGKSIHMRKEAVAFGGKVVDAVRVSPVDFDDDIPQ